MKFEDVKVPVHVKEITKIQSRENEKKVKVDTKKADNQQVVITIRDKAPYALSQVGGNSPSFLPC